MVSSFKVVPWASSKILLMKKLRPSSLLPWDSDNKHLANLNDWGYLIFPFPSSILPNFASNSVSLNRC